MTHIPFHHGIVVTSRWQVADRHAQRAAADSAMARWNRLPWPEGCLSIACFLSTDGQLILFYTQWTDERHAMSFKGQDADDLEPGTTRLDTIVSRPADPPSSRSADGPFPGCVALITIATDDPDHQRQAAESIAAIGAQADPGAIGGHVLFSLDGTRVILYAEWTSEEAHREAVAGAAFGGERGIFDGRKGIQGLTMNRYQPYRASTVH